MLSRGINWIAILTGFVMIAASAVVSPVRTYAVRVNQVLFSPEEVAALAGGSAREMVGASESDVQNRMVDALVDNELLYQYGVKLGLQNSDPVVRRRVVQLVLEMDATSVGVPTEEQLQAYFDLNTTRYQGEESVQFLQLYQSVAVTDTSVARAMRAVQSRVDFEQAQHQYGEDLRLHDPAQYYTTSQLVSLYGPAFAHAVTQATLDHVQGPIASSLGWHWVWLVDHRAATAPAFGAIRSLVERDWKQDAGTAAHRRLLDTLRSQADIDVRSPR